MQDNPEVGFLQTMEWLSSGVQFCLKSEGGAGNSLLVLFMGETGGETHFCCWQDQ